MPHQNTLDVNDLPIFVSHLDEVKVIARVKRLVNVSCWGWLSVTSHVERDSTVFGVF
jgi:hypothetical protein